MKQKIIRLEDMKDRNPFRVPEGYFDNLTAEILSKLPEQKVVEARTISLYDRIKPWLYMAAAFAGIIVMFGIVNKHDLFNNGEMASKSSSVIIVNETIDDDDEYMEFIEDMYSDKYASVYFNEYIDSEK